MSLRHIEVFCAVIYQAGSSAERPASERLPKTIRQLRFLRHAGKPHRIYFGSGSLKGRLATQQTKRIYLFTEARGCLR